MDTVLIVLTCASIAAAITFAVSAWRVRAEDARRSSARVAALSSAIDASERFASPTAAHEPVAVTSLFTTSSGASVQGRPLVRMGVFAGLAAAFLIVVAIANREDAAPVVAPKADAALELVSMHHTRAGRSLTVSGLVRNPRDAAARSHISAVVFAFGRGGEFVTSGRAALDFTNLAPGDESPFVVRLPPVAGIVRYRVSFRTEDGIVRHVDRRADQLQASTN
jgi:hypothetical protein